MTSAVVYFEATCLFAVCLFVSQNVGIERIGQQKTIEIAFFDIPYMCTVLRIIVNIREALYLVRI